MGTSRICHVMSTTCLHQPQVRTRRRGRRGRMPSTTPTATAQGVECGEVEAAAACLRTSCSYGYYTQRDNEVRMTRNIRKPYRRSPLLFSSLLPFSSPLLSPAIRDSSFEVLYTARYSMTVLIESTARKGRAGCCTSQVCLLHGWIVLNSCQWER